MKNKKISKSTKIFLLVGCLALSTTAVVTTTTVLLMKKKTEIIYLFENQRFDNREQIFDYAYAKAKNTNYSFENLKYLIDDKVFNSESEFNQFINANYPIQSVSTIKNPNDYLINNSGELSPLVLTGQTEKGTSIYKGINGNAFFSKDSALDTYLNSFEEKYSIDGSTFDNLYSAQNYYKQVILDRLEDKENKPIKVYTRGGIQYSESEIKSWLKDSLKRGFEYNGKTFSDYNYSEFLEVMNDLDHHIIEDNIKPVMNADKTTYWIDHISSNINGYFVGPKYLESNENIPSNAEFKVIDSQDVNVFWVVHYLVLS